MRTRTVTAVALVVAFVAIAVAAFAVRSTPGSTTSVSTETIASTGPQPSLELENLGHRIWIADLVFPPNLGWSSDWQDFGSGPHLDSVTRVNSTTVVIVAQSGGIIAYSNPGQGRFEIILSKNYTQNNFSPGLVAGDVVTFREAAPGESSIINTPTYGNVEVDSVFCNVTLYRNGGVYQGFGTWGYFTGERFSDPSPGTASSVSGWVETPSFILTFANNYGWSSYTGRIIWANDHASESVLVNSVDTSQTCTGYTLSTSSSRGPLTIEIPTLKLLLGTPCSATKGTINESFGAASSNQGSGWAFIGVTK